MLIFMNSANCFEINDSLIPEGVTHDQVHSFYETKC